MTKLAFSNIFDAITPDRAEAADLKFRSDLVILLRDYFTAKKWSQADVMKKLGILQPRASELLTGKIHTLSSGRLIGYLGTLEIPVDPAFKVSRKGRVRCDIRLSASA